MLGMPRRAINRELLIASLAEVFCARGFEGATLAELSRATGLGKASLYHHFPGGKSEMVGVLVRHAINDLQRSVFRHLDEPGSAKARVNAMLDGFDRYVADGSSNCVLAVLAQGSARDALGAGVSSQFDSWLARLEQTLVETAMKPKRAHRMARHIIVTLYGGLVLARLLDDADAYRTASKRLRKELGL